MKLSKNSTWLCLFNVINVTLFLKLKTTCKWTQCSLLWLNCFWDHRAHASVYPKTGQFLHPSSLFQILQNYNMMSFGPHLTEIHHVGRNSASQSKVNYLNTINRKYNTIKTINWWQLFILKLSSGHWNMFIWIFFCIVIVTKGSNWVTILSRIPRESKTLV